MVEIFAVIHGDIFYKAQHSRGKKSHIGVDDTFGGLLQLYNYTYAYELMFVYIFSGSYVV